MASFDFDAAVRWARPRALGQLARRNDPDLPFAGDRAEAGQALLLDTCVYIDGLQGRAPDVVADLIEVRTANHSTVAIQELMHAVGALDPAHSGTGSAIRQIGTVVKAMPAHRIFSPDADVAGRAALVAGILCRIQNYRGDARLRALQGSMLFLQALKLGLCVLTANVRDFDYLGQLIPGGRTLFYRPTVSARGH